MALVALLNRDPLLNNRILGPEREEEMIDNKCREREESRLPLYSFVNEINTTPWTVLILRQIPEAERETLKNRG